MKPGVLKKKQMPFDGTARQSRIYILYRIDILLEY